MEYKDAAEQKMIATFAYYIIKAIFLNSKDGKDELKKVFLASVLTPKDIVTESRKHHLRSGNIKDAIYEDIQFALYVEMRDNKNSKVVDAVYNSAQAFFKKYFNLNEYKQFARDVRNGKIDTYEYGAYAVYSFVYFFLWYERVPLGVNLQRSMKLQYQHLVKNTQVESENVNTDIMAGCSYGDSMPIVESKIYASCFDMVVQKLAEFLAVRYPSDNVTTNNMCHVIQKKLHFGVHWDFKNHKIFADSIDLYSETIMSGVSWVGVDRHKMSMDILSNVMGDFSFNAAKLMNYHPDVQRLIELAFQSHIRPYQFGKNGKLTRAVLRDTITARIVNNIEAFYNYIVNLYYEDCLFKTIEYYRDEYYYNFPWFYDIEKQDTLIEAPGETEQYKEQKKVDDGYAELNAQYERERKRVNEVCKKHAHELAERDRAIAAQTGEIEKLQKQIQLQQEYLNLVNAAEEPDVTETLDISSLYGKRFLFVGKLHESNAKLKQTFPTSTFMETDTANIKSLKVDGVVFLIRNMGHSMYYKVMQNNQFAELPKIYCNSRNINNIYQAMLQGIENDV